MHDEGRVGANRFGGLRIIGHDLVVGAQVSGRRDHHAGCARLHRLARQRAHGGEARRGNADDDGPASHDRHRTLDDGERFPRLELRRLAENAEDRDAIGADARIEVEEAVEARPVDCAIRRERRGCDRIDAGGGRREFHFFFQAS